MNTTHSMDLIGVADVAPAEILAAPPLGCPMADPLDLAPCCMGYAMDGLSGCTCWEPHETTVEPDAPDGEPCHDCAGLPGSPEDVAGLWPRIVRQPKRFHCHAGMARVLSERHPVTGEVRPRTFAEMYDAKHKDGVSYRADGRPARPCVCWVRERQKQRLEVCGG